MPNLPQLTVPKIESSVVTVNTGYAHCFRLDRVEQRSSFITNTYFFIITYRKVHRSWGSVHACQLDRLGSCNRWRIQSNQCQGDCRHTRLRSDMKEKEFEEMGNERCLRIKHYRTCLQYFSQSKLIPLPTSK